MAQKIFRNSETTIFLLLTDGNNFCQSLSAQQLHVKENKFIFQNSSNEMERNHFLHLSIM